MGRDRDRAGSHGGERGEPVVDAPDEQHRAVDARRPVAVAQLAEQRPGRLDEAVRVGAGAVLGGIPVHHLAR